MALCCAPLAPWSAWAAGGADASQAAMGALNLANHHYKHGKFKKAAAMYHEAYRIDPKPAFLFNAARAEMRAFAHDDAERDFRRYLALPDASAKGKRRAQMHLDEVKAYRVKMAAQKRAAAAAATAAAARTRKPIGGLTVALWASGGAFILGSGVLYGVAWSGRLRTNKSVMSTQEDIDDHQDEVELQDNLRMAALGLGAAGVGLAVWGTIRAVSRGHEPSKGAGLQLAPWTNGRALGLVGRF